jgi:hypothetical protein
MKKKTFDAVAMTRRIRDAHAEQLADATSGDRILFYREKAQRLHAELGHRKPQSPDNRAE